MPLYYKQPTNVDGMNQFSIVAARWLVNRGVHEFSTLDIMPFISYMRTHKPDWLIDNPMPEKLNDAVKWCQKNLVGFKAHSTNGPDPFLLN